MLESSCNAIHNVTIFMWNTGSNNVTAIYAAFWHKENPQELLNVIIVNFTVYSHMQNLFPTSNLRLRSR